MQLVPTARHVHTTLCPTPLPVLVHSYWNWGHKHPWSHGGNPQTHQGPHNYQWCGQWWPEPTAHYAPQTWSFPRAPTLRALKHQTQGHSMHQCTPKGRCFLTKVSTENWTELTASANVLQGYWIMKNQESWHHWRNTVSFQWLTPKKWRSQTAPQIIQNSCSKGAQRATENIDEQFNKIRKATEKQNEKFNKDIKTLKRTKQKLSRCEGYKHWPEQVNRKHLH